MQSDYAQQYEALWRRHWWWRAREAFVSAHLSRQARREPARTGRRILDIGCGNGLYFDTLQRYGEVWGIEPDAGLVTDGPHRQRISVRPFDDSYVAPDGRPMDWILMLDVLEHIEDDAAAARHVHAILAPGGTLFLTVPALMCLWSQHDVANHHFRRYARESITRVLAAAGFEVTSARYFFCWAVVPLLARRLLAPADARALQGAYRVQVPPAPVNWIFHAKSRFEQALTGNGRVGWPVGSSLMVIARKAG